MNNAIIKTIENKLNMGMTTRDALRLSLTVASVIIAVASVITVITVSIHAKSVEADSIEACETIVHVTGSDDYEPEINIKYINSEIHDMGELTTAEKSYIGSLRFEDGKIPFITKYGYTMTYTANIRAGIDFSDVHARVDGDVVVIEMPSAEEQLFYVEPESIAFYDEKHALFEGDGKYDLQVSLVSAETDARENFDMSPLLKEADDKAESLVYNLVREIVGDVEVVIER